jgi:hypothetical protein
MYGPYQTQKNKNCASLHNLPRLLFQQQFSVLQVRVVIFWTELKLCAMDPRLEDLYHESTFDIDCELAEMLEQENEWKEEMFEMALKEAEEEAQ